MRIATEPTSGRRSPPSGCLRLWQSKRQPNLTGVTQCGSPATRPSAPRRRKAKRPRSAPTETLPRIPSHCPCAPNPSVRAHAPLPVRATWPGRRPRAERRPPRGRRRRRRRRLDDEVVRRRSGAPSPRRGRTSAAGPRRVADPNPALACRGAKGNWVAGRSRRGGPSECRATWTRLESRSRSRSVVSLRRRCPRTLRVRRKRVLLQRRIPLELGLEAGLGETEGVRGSEASENGALETEAPCHTGAGLAESQPDLARWINLPLHSPRPAETPSGGRPRTRPSSAPLGRRPTRAPRRGL